MIALAYTIKRLYIQGDRPYYMLTPRFTSQLFRIWFLEFSDTIEDHIFIFVRFLFGTDIIKSRVLWIYAHFCFTSENAIFHYKLVSG